MSDSGRTPEFFWLALIAVPVCAFGGGYLGFQEVGGVGSIIGALAGAFLGFLGSYIFMVLLGIGMIVAIFLSPIALLVAIGYWLLKYRFE